MRSERPPFSSASHFTFAPQVQHSVSHSRDRRGGRSLLRYRRTYPCGKAGMKTPEETLRFERPPVTWRTVAPLGRVVTGSGVR